MKLEDLTDWDKLKKQDLADVVIGVLLIFLMLLVAILIISIGVAALS